MTQSNNIVVVPFEPSEVSGSLSPMDMPRALQMSVRENAIEVRFQYYAAADETETETEATFAGMRIWVGKETRRVLRFEVPRNAAVSEPLANTMRHALQGIVSRANKRPQPKERELAHYKMIPETGPALDEALKTLRIQQGSLRP